MLIAFRLEWSHQILNSILDATFIPATKLISEPVKITAVIFTGSGQCDFHGLCYRGDFHGLWINFVAGTQVASNIKFKFW